MDADNPKIIVEVPQDKVQNVSAHLSTPRPRLEAFREHWLNVLAPADNLGDLLFDSLWTISVSAFITSTVLFIPIPQFIRAIGWVFIAIFVFFLLQILRHIPEIRGLMSFRLALVAIGVVLGL